MKRKQYTRGLRVGVPISLGYLAVAFTMGITARNAGLSAVQATLTSFLVNASAGQYAAFTLMAAQGGYLEMAILELVTNARYLLMSCSLSQKLSPKTKLWQRLTVGFAVTDEMFGMAIAEPEEVSPWYYFGMMSIAIPGWSLGTFLGTTVGNILPANVVSALSVALYGMFIAIIVPPARRSRFVAGLIAASMALSALLTCLSCFQFLSSGMRVILLTVALSAAAAILKPIEEASA